MNHQEIATECIAETCDDIKKFLLEKNAAYGNSAFDPVRIYSKNCTPKEQIRVRIDDKLSRLSRGSEFPGDDTFKDLLGYLILDRAYDLYENRVTQNP